MYYHCKLCYRKKNDKSFYTKYILNNVNIDEVDKIFNYYITTHNKKFDSYYFNCEIEIQFNNYIANVEIDYRHNTHYISIEWYLLFYIDSYVSGESKFSCINNQFINTISSMCNINHMVINTISCKCNITYEHYLSLPMPMVERRINFIIAKNPKLINSLNCNKNHPLIRKYSHIPFNN